MNSTIRDQFPSLKRIINGKPVIYLDGPAGTQVPLPVIEEIAGYYKKSNANTGGQFISSHETDQLLDGTRDLLTDFLGTEDKSCISFGQNMTTLNFSLSRALEKKFNPGDEIVITQLDHEANRGPWLGLKSSGIIIREVKLNPDGQLDYDDFRAKINEKTKLVVVGWASNIFGTVNQTKNIKDWADKVGAWFLVDAVHYAPHFKMDVQELGCDFLLCSAYKFYGPHVGILYCKKGLLDQLEPDRLRTQKQQSPFRIETGTLNHAAIAGVLACLEFIKSIGMEHAGEELFQNAYDAIQIHERNLAKQLYDGLSGIKGIRVYGPDFQYESRAPTISFIVDGKSPEEVCKELGSKGIFAWDGHFYAIRACEVLGLREKGGVIRMGISLYNTIEEIDRVLRVVDEIAGG